MTENLAAPANSSRIRWFVEAMASWVMAIAVVVVIIQVWEPSGRPDIFIFSWLRMVLILALAFGLMFLLVSPFVVLLRVFNRDMVIILLLTLLLHEGVIRAFPEILHDQIAALLPGAVKQEIFDQHGILKNTQGQGLLYYFKPHTQSKDHPWITSDADGYRNPTAPNGDLDAVFLGGSTMLAAGLREDLASMARRRGLNAQSLAMGSYSVYQSRDALERFIGRRGLKVRHVIVMVSLSYDLSKALSYRLFEKAGGDWRDYIAKKRPAMNLGLSEEAMPWTLVIANRLPFYLAQAFRNATRAKRIEELQYVNPGNRMVDIRGDTWSAQMPHIDFSYHTIIRPRHLAFLREGLLELIATARKLGAQTHVLLLPSKLVRVLPLVVGEEELRRQKTAFHVEETTLLRQIANEGGAHFLDLTVPLQQFSRRHHTIPGDIHLDQAEMNRVFREIEPILTEKKPL